VRRFNIKHAQSAHFCENVGNYVEVMQLPGPFRVSISQRTCNSRVPNRNMSITMPNRLYEPNESQCSPTEQKILTIDPIDFHICRSDRTERERERERDREKESDCIRVRSMQRCVIARCALCVYINHRQRDGICFFPSFSLLYKDLKAHAREDFHDSVLRVTR